MFVNEYGASYTNKRVGDYSLISGSLGGIRAAESSIGIINSNTLNKQKYCSILITANSIGISVNNNNINEECHTWYNWKLLGKEVIHESKCLFQVKIEDIFTRNGYRILSYFGLSQVKEIEN